MRLQILIDLTNKNYCNNIMRHKKLIVSSILLFFLLLIIGWTKIIKQNVNTVSPIQNRLDFKCEDKIFAGKGYSICGYGIANPEIIPQDILYENPDIFSGSIKTYRVTGKTWEERLAPCPEKDDPRGIPQQCGIVNKYIEIKSIEVVE